MSQVLNLNTIKQSLSSKNDQQLFDILYYSQDDYDKSVVPIVGEILIERGFTREDITKANESYQNLIIDIKKQKIKTGKKSGFWIRASNYILDHCIFYYGIMYLVQYFLRMNGAIDPNEYYGIGVLSFIFYYAITTWLFGATIGMLIVGLRIVNTENKKPSIGDSILRGVCMFVNFLILSIGHLWIFNEDKRTLIDRGSKTFVVYKG